MPVSERKPANNQCLRASDRLAPIPEEEVDKPTTQSTPNPPPPSLGSTLLSTILAPFRSTQPTSTNPNTTTHDNSNPPEEPQVRMGFVQRIKWLCRWDIVLEKNFYKYLFSFVYGIAIISFFTSTMLDHRSYVTSIFLFHRILAGTYIIGFYSIWVQIMGLCGKNGILPIKDTMEALTESKKQMSRVPTVFWFNQSDQFIHFVCVTGLVSSFLYLINVLPKLMQIILFIAFLSFKTVGREFFALQFDNLLLDVSIWAILLPPIRIIPFFEISTSDFYNLSILFMLRWLLFRLMVGSGLCKVSSGDKTWRNGTALTYHYWSQPMPNWLSYYASLLPLKLQRFSCYYHFFVELASPFGVFFPILFVPTFLVQFSLQMGILITGNYGFFNILTILLCFSMLPDSIYPESLRNLLAPYARTAHGPIWITSASLVVALVGFVLVLSLVAFSQVARGNMEIPEWIQKIQARISRFGVMNYYGLFARMTTSRREVIIEGSDDGKNWAEYELFYKPGDVKRCPPFVIGHLPRLDWRLWFCQFTHFNSFLPGWFDLFLMKLLEGSPEVLSLISRNPFPHHPPRFLRALIYDYNFPDKDKRSQGYWWVRTQKKLWWPPCTLHNGKMMYLR